MRPTKLRSLVATAFVLALGGLAWYYLAPTQIGGSTRYVITHGVSMEPLLHQGDLVLVRPADHYRVGQVVAYHSSLLHTVVLHRINHIRNGHYYFKGDNNNFIDPTHPTRALLIGKMWVHIPQGGIVVRWLHQPWVAALLFGTVAMFVLFGGGERRRRRDRGRRGGSGDGSTRGARPVTSHLPGPVSRTRNRDRFVACAVGAVVFGVLTLLGFVLPADNTTVTKQPYVQRLSFGYHANVRPGVVYPSGTVSTGDPVYLQLVHVLTVTATYRITTKAPHQLHGTIGMRATLSNTSGWHRSFWLAPPAPFVGNSARTTASVNLTRFENLATRIATQIGAAAGGYTLAVTPRVKIAGTIGGDQVSATYSPALNLGINAAQLLSPGSAVAQPSSSGSSASSGLAHTTAATATTVHSSTNTILGIPVVLIRWLALIGLLLCGWGAYVFRRRDRESAPPRNSADRIKSRYKHLIVPVESIATSPDHAPIEVSSIDALAQLAERSERLILHDQQEDVDNYMIDDQGTLYRFSAPRIARAEVSVAVGADATDDGANLGTGAVDGTMAVSDEPAAEDVLSDAGGIRDSGVSAPEASPPEVESPRVSDRRFRSRRIGDPRMGDPRVSDPSLSDPDASEPDLSDPAAIIFRSAAAALSAAATSAGETVEDRAGSSDRPVGDDRPGRGERSGHGDNPTGADRRSGDDRRRVSDRSGAGDRRGERRPDGAGDQAVSPTAAGDDQPVTREHSTPVEPRRTDAGPTSSTAGTRSDPNPPNWVRGAPSTGAPTEPMDTPTVSSRSMPDLLVFDAEPTRPPIAPAPNWITRRDVRAGFAIGPLALAFLAWQRARARRRRLRGDDAIESTRRVSWRTRNNLPRR